MEDVNWVSVSTNLTKLVQTMERKCMNPLISSRNLEESSCMQFLEYVCTTHCYRCHGSALWLYFRHAVKKARPCPGICACLHLCFLGSTGLSSKPGWTNIPASIYRTQYMLYAGYNWIPEPRIYTWSYIEVRVRSNLFTLFCRPPKLSKAETCIQSVFRIIAEVIIKTKRSNGK